MNVPSKKSTICKFVFISILKSAFLKISIMCFHIWSDFCLAVFHKSTRPSFLHKPVDCLSSLFDSKGNIWMLTRRLPMVKSKQLSVLFFFQGSLLLYNKDFLQCFIINELLNKSSELMSKCPHANNFYCAIIKQSIDCNPLIGKQQWIRFYVGMFVTTSLIWLKILKYMKLKVANKLLYLLNLFHLFYIYTNFCIASQNS